MKTDQNELEQRVVNYLEAHPTAADTLDGIMQWWLNLGYPEQTARLDVYQALLNLKDRGVVLSRVLADGQEIFMLNRHEV